MTKDIKKVVVVGAGTMGSGIAAQLANAGVKSILLDDYVPANQPDRAAFPKAQIERMQKAKPADFMNAGFMHPSNAKLITPGNTDDDLEAAIRDADWIIEVITEDVEKKKELFARIDAAKKPGAIVTSNTSSIPLHTLIEGRSDDFRRNAAITHFFNPPRFMNLLELVPGKDTDPAVMETLGDFCDRKLGKNILVAKDTPGFIANRVGAFFSFRTMAAAIEQGVTVEDADAVLGKPLGMPKGGVFGMTDIVGLKLIPHLIESFRSSLPADDAFSRLDEKPAMAIVNKLISEGRTGRASPTKNGFYQVRSYAAGKIKLTVNLKTGEYELADPLKPAAALAGKKGKRAVFEEGSNVSQFAWTVMRDTLLYAASLVPEIADTVADVDAGMRWGYNWEKGPFEILDEVGVDWFADRVKQDGLELPPLLQKMQGQTFYKDVNGIVQHAAFDGETLHFEAQPVKDGVLDLRDIKRNSKPLITHNGASTWDIGGGVVCVELHSLKDTMDPTVLHVLNESRKLIEGSKGRYTSMVVYNDGPNFSVGANLGLLNERYKIAENTPLTTLNKMFTDKTLRSLKVPKGAAEALTKTIAPVCAYLDKFDATRKLAKERLVYQPAEELVWQGQAVYQALREAPFPVVAAIGGFAFGGGCELPLHCDAVQAHSETYMGLVEAGVGVVPAWGGCARMLERAFNAQAAGLLKKGQMAAIQPVFKALAAPQEAISASAQDAKRKLWLNPDDSITMNRSRLLFDARAKAKSLEAGYQPKPQATFRLPGKSGAAALRMGVDNFYALGFATSHDVAVADAVINVLTGGDTHPGKDLTESDIKQLEREAFLSLLRTDGTRHRIQEMAERNKFVREPTEIDLEALDAHRAVRSDVSLAWREVTGEALSGKEGKALKASAAETRAAIRHLNPDRKYG